MRNGQAAQYYALHFGWQVFPCHWVHDGRCSCGGNPCKEDSPGKHPLIKNGVKNATKDLRSVKSWWDKWPAANIAVATGWLSGFFAVDIDGPEGEQSLDDWHREHGPLPDTVESITGSGGRHILFQHPGMFDIRNSTKTVAPGIDIRGDGGYIIVAPSSHISGRRYEWELSSRPDEVAIALAPQWLLDKLRDGIATEYKPTPPSEWQRLAQGVTEGGRNDAIARITGLLLRRDIEATLTLELMLSWNRTHCRPPLSDAEVVKTVNSIAGREFERRKGGRRYGG